MKKNYFPKHDATRLLLIDIDIIPNYIDMTPLPAQSQMWRYKAIYRIDNDKAGQWSDVMSVLVST